MRKFLAEAARAAGSTAATLWSALKRFLVWVSPPGRAIAAALILVFSFSFLVWAIADGRTAYVLFFPDAKGRGTGSETRDLPRRWSPESAAELLVQEFLLGPADPALSPALPAGSTLEGILFRKGTLYVDLGAEAALTPEPELTAAIDDLEKTIALGVRQVRRVVLTMGGQQPRTAGE